MHRVLTALAAIGGLTFLHGTLYANNVRTNRVYRITVTALDGGLRPPCPDVIWIAWRAGKAVSIPMPK